MLSSLGAATLVTMTVGSSAYAYRFEVSSGGDFYAGAFDFSFAIAADTNIGTTPQVATFAGNGGDQYAINRFALSEANGVISLSLNRTNANGGTVHDFSSFAFAEGVTTLERGQVYTVKYKGGSNGTAAADLVNAAGNVVASFTGGNHNMNGFINPLRTTFTSSYSPGAYTWNVTSGESGSLDYTSAAWTNQYATGDTTLVKGADVVFGNDATLVKNVSVADRVYVDTVTVGGAYTLSGGGTLAASSLSMTGSLSLGDNTVVELTNGTTTLTSASKITGTGTVKLGQGGVLELNHSGGTSAVTSNIEIAAGGLLKLTPGDALGWNGYGTSAFAHMIKLEGASDNLAKMEVTNKQTLSVNINLAGNSQISGGQLEFYGAGISASGTNNTISSGLMARNAATITVAENGELVVSGDISCNTGQYPNPGAITKEGAGKLVLSGTNKTLNGALNVNAGTLEIQNGLTLAPVNPNKENSTPGSLNLSNGATLIIGSEITNNGSGTIALGGNVVINNTNSYDFLDATSVVYSEGNENGFCTITDGEYRLIKGGTVDLTGVGTVTLDGTEKTSTIEAIEGGGAKFSIAGDVTSTKYYVNNGDVTVSTEAQATATSYEINGGNMKVAEGSIAGNTINFNTAESSLEVSGTASITGTLTASQGSASITGGSVATLAATGAEVTVSGGTVTTLNASAGSVAVSGGSVTTMEVSGGTGSVSGGTVATLKVSGGTANITGGTINAVDFANTGNLNFKLAEGQSSTSYTLNSISYTTGTNYQRNVTIDSGVNVSLTTLDNGWGMGTLTVNGELSVSESLAMATGSNNSTTNNVITGSGTINTAKLILGNAGTYNISGVTMKIGAGGIKKDSTNYWGDYTKTNLGAVLIEASADWESDVDTLKLVATDSASTVINTASHTVDLKAGISGTGNLTKTGEGTLKIGTKTNALSGAVEVSGGSLSFYNTEEDASTTLDNLTLSGGTLDVTGTLTLNALSIDLSKYSTDQEIHTLISAGTLSLGEGVNLSSLGGNVGNYTATVAQSGNTITLSLKLEDVTSTDWSLVGTPSYDTASNMLTLNVGADLLNYDFTNNGAIIIPGIDDAMMKDILGLSGLPADGMVGITLVGGDGQSVTATADQQIGFQGKDGIYYGEQVCSAWQYQVAYIPEPTTATLSLLALAGLAARRRRKA